MCSFGLSLLDQGVDAVRRSLDTLRSFQSPLGNIPHNVGFPNSSDAALIQAGTANADSYGSAAQADTAHAGCIDSAAW